MKTPIIHKSNEKLIELLITETRQIESDMTNVLKTAEELTTEVGSLAGLVWTKNDMRLRTTDETKPTDAKTSHGLCETQLLAKVDAGFRKRNAEELKKVIERYWEDEAPVLSRGRLIDALEELNIIFSKEEEVDCFLETMDTSGDGALDFEEFKRMMLQLHNQ